MGASPHPTVSDIICAYKYLVTMECKRLGYVGHKIFQRSFHDHIIRNEADYKNISSELKASSSKYGWGKILNEILFCFEKEAFISITHCRKEIMDSVGLVTYIKVKLQLFCEKRKKLFENQTTFIN